MKKADGTGILKKQTSQRIIAGSLASTSPGLGKGNVNFATNRSGLSETGLKPKPSKLAPLKVTINSSDISQTLGRSGSPKTFSRGSPKQFQVSEEELPGRLAEYKGEEDSLPCKRFPHKKFCGCDHKCYEIETNPRFKPTLVSKLLNLGHTRYLCWVHRVSN
jgi:hypothetical protein